MSSEFAHGHLEPTALWLTNCEDGGAAEVVKSTVEVDVLRLLREVVPLRIKKPKLRVVQSKECRCVLGRDVLQVLEEQDCDRTDPLQSDWSFNEEREVENFLEAAFDRAKLTGLPKKHWLRYRKLLFDKYNASTSSG